MTLKYMAFWAVYGVVFLVAARLFIVNPLISALKGF
jgi:hypothetical protein